MLRPYFVMRGVVGIWPTPPRSSKPHSEKRSTYSPTNSTPFPHSHISIGIFVILLLVGVPTARAQSSGKAGPTFLATAFVNVNVVPMDRETILVGQTVIVLQGRIVAVGPVAATRVPAGARVIDGRGRYLMPGLSDMHVHLEGRKDFGDAPLFLAYGITTVLNLRGNPEHLAWKKEIAEGKLLAPNLFTSGEFVNEPRVNTPDEVEREVMSQKDAGYDVIKFHEIVAADGRYVTTHGLSRPAYDAMNATARRVGIPLIGHAPDNLGLQAVLADHQSLAHSGILVALYFLPKARIESHILFSLASIGALLLLTLGLLVAAIIFSLRGRQMNFDSELRTTASLTVLSLLFLIMWPIFGLLSGSLFSYFCFRCSRCSLRSSLSQHAARHFAHARIGAGTTGFEPFRLSWLSHPSLSQ